MQKVLIVDDDRDLCALMKKCVEQENRLAVTAHSGAEGLRRLREGGYALAVLDIMLPDLDGLQVLRQIRQESNLPVLLLTAKSGEEDKVSGLRLGADDYLTKPFSLRELLARIDSLIRRYTQLNPGAGSEPGLLTFRGLTIDRDSRLAALRGEPVELTGREFDLLAFLAENPGKVFTKKQIYTHVWADEYAFDDSNIMSFISKLRRKIEPDPEHPYYIRTVRGVGYRFNPEARP